MWHNDAGLVVSPFNRTIPSVIDEPCEYTNSSTQHQHPKKRPDDLIWLAFYPIRDVNSGPLFSVLSVTREEIHNAIEEVPNGDGPAKYRLKEDLRNSWAQLEDSLLSVVESLMAPQSQIYPPIQYPRWPHQYGYKDANKSREGVLNAVRGAKGAFRMLAAVLSFALSLWLTPYEDDCFEKAFTYLSTRPHDPIPRVWLDSLARSSVCNLAPGTRPGAFINPYTSRWGRAFEFFCRASVPIWILWGENYKEKVKSISDPCMANTYLPNDKIIEQAKMTTLEYSQLILPGRRNYRPLEGARAPPDAAQSSSGMDLPLDQRRSQGGGPHPSDTSAAREGPAAKDPRANVERGALQKPHETWEMFFARMQEAYERRKTQEDPKTKQQREDHERYAAKHGWSKGSRVFIWEQDDIDASFYRRKPLGRDPEVIEGEWRQTTRHQRFFWGHLNQWDLCPHLPTQPPGAEPVLSEQDLDDLEDEDLHQLETQMNATFSANNEAVGPGMLLTVHATFARHSKIRTLEYDFPHSNIVDYLRLRHGFNATIGGWNPGCHATDKERKDCLARNESALVVKKLLYGPLDVRLEAQTFEAIVDFWNTALNRSLKLADLPMGWDISPTAPEESRLVLNRSIVACERAFGKKDGNDMYILQPGALSKHQSEWFVATPDATTVLLVYRSGWQTMFEIARGLLDLGIPFRTVIKMRKSQFQQRPSSFDSQGLGYRPNDFAPKPIDYLEYTEMRDEVLKSYVGRAIRMAGGLVGRIAAEIVPDVDVFAGPVYKDEVVADSVGDFCFVDDCLEDERLDVVCGVFRVQLNHQNQHAHSKSSFWPQHSTWLQSGLAGDQWTPRAEEFYRQRLKDFEDGRFNIFSSREWKTKHKMDVKALTSVRTTSRELASSFVRLPSLV